MDFIWIDGFFERPQRGVRAERCAERSRSIENERVESNFKETFPERFRETRMTRIVAGFRGFHRATCTFSKLIIESRLAVILKIL